MKHPFFIYLHLYSLLKCFGHPDSGSVHETCEGDEHCDLRPETQGSPKRPWLSDIFCEAEQQFTVYSGASSKCKHDFDLYALHLRNHSLWAIRMFESSQWPRVGILMGMKPSLGHFDECVMINAYNIKGQHCLVENEIRFKEFESVTPKHVFDMPPEDGSAWLALQMYENDEFRIRRNLFRWSICIPASCSESDLSESLSQTLNEVFGKYSVDIKTVVRENRCHVQARKFTPSETYHVKYFVDFPIFLVIFSSLFMILCKYDPTDQRLLVNIMKCFSIQENFRRLVHIVPERESMLFEVYRVLMSAVVHVVHRSIYTAIYVHYNANVNELAPHPSKNIQIFMGDPVGTLFFLSGALTYKGFIGSKKNDVVSILERIGRRWFRLFPTYLFIRLIYAYVLPAFNNGPLWHHIDDEAAYCKTNLLEALLTLPAARDFHRMCYPASWTIPVDFQLFIVGHVCLTLCDRFRMNLVKCSLFMMFASILATIGIALYNQTIGTLFMSVRPFDMDRSGEKLDSNYVIFVSKIYRSMTPRLSSYMMGIIVGYIANEFRKCEYFFPKALVISGYLVTLGARIVSGVSMYALYEQLIKRRAFNLEWHAAHAALFPALSTLPTAFLFLVYFVNGFDSLEKRIPRIFVPLGRLSFAAITSHTMVIHFHLFSRRTLTADTDIYSVVYLFVSDFVISYIFALGTYLVVEAPILRFYNLMVNFARNSKIQQVGGKDGTSTKNE